MLSITDFDEYYDQMETHNEYITLMEEYYETEIYTEIIHFMNIAFPEWNTNQGIGYWSAEFILTSIQNLEQLEVTETYTSKDLLEDYYKSLVEDYNRTKIEFSFSLADSILNNFNIEHQIILEENENLPKNDFNALYDDLYETYKIKVSKEITYTFQLNV